MSSSFADSFDHVDDNSPAASTQPFDDGFAADDSDIFNSHQPLPDSPPIYASGLDPSEFSSNTNGSILPPPEEMQKEEGQALREWRRQNAARLEEKEKIEKELLSKILEEAEEYKIEFQQKRQATCETNRASNREREKVFLESQVKFHAEADKNYWKSITELIPKEVPTIEKKGKKDQEKKPTVVVLQGPKPGKPTDLSRMRQILLKLKHDTPSHLKLSPDVASTSGKDDKDVVIVDSPDTAGLEVSSQPVAVA